MNKTIKIWWDTTLQAYRVSTPFDADFVTTFKQVVPISDRAWDKETRLWTVSERTLPVVKDLVGKFFKGATVTVVTKEQSQSANTPQRVMATPLDTVCVQLVKLMGHDAMQKAYRHAAMTNHPDRGGDMEKMAQINSLWTRMETELWPQT